jgi:hypothetical protein
MDTQNPTNANPENQPSTNDGVQSENNNPVNEEKKQDLVPHQKFHEERERRKAAEERLKQFETERAEQERQAKEKQGEFETLYKEEKTQREILAKEREDLLAKVTGFESATQNRINSQIDSLKTEEDKEMVKKLLNGKSLSEQEELLPSLLQKLVTPVNINSQPSNSNKEEVPKDRQTKMEEAKKSNNIAGMLSNAPILNQK